MEVAPKAYRWGGLDGMEISGPGYAQRTFGAIKEKVEKNLMRLDKRKKKVKKEKERLIVADHCMGDAE